MSLTEEPIEADCCGSGCNPCIFDIYEQLKNKKVETIDVNVNNCISQINYAIFQLTNIKVDTNETFLYTFKFIKMKNHEHNLNNYKLIFKPGQHFLLRGNNDNELFTRAYTPISITKNNDLSFTILIKFYENGKMSNYIKQLNVLSETFWRGPYGDYEINYKLKNILMICQGTGIAPIYSIIKKTIENDDCETILKLFFCCRHEIYLRNELNKMALYWNFTFNVFLSNSDDKFEKKYNENVCFRKLNENDVKCYVEDKNIDSFQVLICGSDTFSKTIEHYVHNCNITKESIYVF